MRKLIITTILFCLAAPAFAQRVILDMPGLAERASEVTEVTLDGALLRLASRFLANSNDPDARAACDIAKNLQGIYVKSYTFDKEGEYDRGIVDRMRSQVASWKRIVTTREKSGETTDIYVDMRGENVAGLAIISAEPKELTLVNIVGPIDLDKLSSLEGQFGIPKVKGKDK
jgi:uncharacterized protein DUF4252